MAKSDLYGTGGSSLYELGPDLRQDDGEGWFHTPHFPGRRAGTDRQRLPPHPPLRGFTLAPAHPLRPFGWQGVYGPVCAPGA